MRWGGSKRWRKIELRGRGWWGWRRRWSRRRKGWNRLLMRMKLRGRRFWERLSSWSSRKISIRGTSRWWWCSRRRKRRLRGRSCRRLPKIRKREWSCRRSLKRSSSLRSNRFLSLQCSRRSWKLKGKQEKKQKRCWGKRVSKGHNKNWKSCRSRGNKRKKGSRR